MAAALPSPSPCCTPACDETTVVNIPGPKGNTGAACTPCADGINAFTLTNDDFTMPAELANVAVTVVTTAWMAVGENIFIANAGYFKVVSIGDNVTVTLKNLEDSGTGVYPDNVAPGTNVASGQKVTPAGITGPAGTGAGDMLKANNLSDVVSTSAARTNIGLGTAAVHATGDFLQTANNLSDVTAATARTNLSLVVGTNVQAWDADLDAIAGLTYAADRLTYFTAVHTAALAVFTSAARSLVDDATLDDMLVTLGRVKKRYGLLGSLAAVDLNAGAVDNACAISASRYIVDKVIIDKPVGVTNITTATLGVFVGAGGGGGTVAADQSLAAITTGTKYAGLTLSGVALTDILTGANLQVRVGTPQGAACVADVHIFGIDLS